MMRGIYITLMYISFFAVGSVAPFVLSLGYVWVDIFNPQRVARALLQGVPLSLIIAIAAIGAYLVLDRRSPPRVTVVTVFTLLLMVWATLSLSWAVLPDDAWTEWNVVWKTLLFSMFFPFVFRSRIQIESFLQVYLFSLFVHFVPFALKTIVSGGGYGMNLGVLSGNSGLAESSTLAAVCLMIIPVILFLRKYTVIVPRSILSDLFYIGAAVLAAIAALGTFARTAVIGAIVLGAMYCARSQRKVLTLTICLLITSAVAYGASDAWSTRINTIQSYDQNNSALGRILVWGWTLGYVQEHPLGGSFDVYKISRIQFPATPTESEGQEVVGRAFHSIYFEVLGELGWVGLGLFVGLILSSLALLQSVVRRARDLSHIAWTRDLAIALQASLVTLAVCGAFIGIAFEPMLYYLSALAVSLREYVRRVEHKAAIT